MRLCWTHRLQSSINSNPWYYQNACILSHICPEQTSKQTWRAYSSLSRYDFSLCVVCDVLIHLSSLSLTPGVLSYQNCLLVYRFFFPSVLSLLLSTTTLTFVVKQASRLYNHIRNEKWACIHTSLVPRPPLFLPSFAFTIIHGSGYWSGRPAIFWFCVLLWTQTGDQNGGGLGPRLHAHPDNHLFYTLEFAVGIWWVVSSWIIPLPSRLKTLTIPLQCKKRENSSYFITWYFTCCLSCSVLVAACV